MRRSGGSDSRRDELLVTMGLTGAIVGGVVFIVAVLGLVGVIR